MDKDRLYIRAGLSFLLLLIFCVLLILIFYVELPSSAEITSATLLGALVGNLTSTLSYWFDSTEHSETKGHNGSTGDETA
jgi:O-antigen/teichoic acid export membrane protein